MKFPEHIYFKKIIDRLYINSAEKSFSQETGYSVNYIRKIIYGKKKISYPIKVTIVQLLQFKRKQINLILRRLKKHEFVEKKYFE